MPRIEIGPPPPGTNSQAHAESPYRLIATSVESGVVYAYHGNGRLSESTLGVLGAIWAGVLFYTSEGQLLLAKRSPGMEKYAELWSLPCTGILDRGEAPRHTIHREILEEWGPHAKPGRSVNRTRFLAAIWNPELVGGGVGLIWQARVENLEMLQADPEEISEWSLFQPTDLPQPQTPDLKRVVELWLG